MINNITIKQTCIDIPDFLAKLRLYLQNQGINLADNVEGPPMRREVAIGYLRGCKLVAVNGRTAVQIKNQALNEALGQPSNAIVKLRAVKGPWDEDWRIAGGRPTNIAVNAPNANNGTIVVVAGIHFSQAIWWLKIHFPKVEEELQDLQYGTIRKGNMTIDELYRKLPEELHNKFLDALPIPWLEKAEDISEHLPLDELAKKLYEIELQRIARHKKDRIPDSLVSQQASREIYELLPIPALQQQGISLKDMQKQAVAQKAQAPASQTVKPVRQPRGLLPSLQTEEGMENFHLSQYLNNLGIFSTEDFDRNYPIKPFQKPHQGRLYSSNQNARMDRIESKVDEISQITSQFGKMMLDNKKLLAKSNSIY
ncbi:631_t:CDS:2 [Cetraspora pellucida]|uniref:631_t:CDS:1 n=1 Tax=Cetraspora pellucida TaxID=1433469 RepID=A0A9N8VR71_9GLOM|nr:631_t:CDS:2 [Cetraspora pellucida]